MKTIGKEEKERLIKEHGKDTLHIAELGSKESSMIEVVVKAPCRDVINQYMRFAGNSPQKAQEILINHCLLTGKEEVMADDQLYFACVAAIAELVDVGHYRIKKL